MPASSSRGLIKSSIEVNCENSNIRRPSSTISVTISNRSSSLLDALTRRAEASFTSRGSQHTCRSFSSASSITTRPRAAVSPGNCSSTLSCNVARIVSYNSRCSGAKSIRRRIVCFGGRSVATSPFVRRSRNGLIRRISCTRRTTSPFFSIGVRYRLANPFRSPSNPGIRNENSDHNSPRLFSIGVPDRQSRNRVSSWQTAFVAFESGLLITCASSSTTRCHGSAAISSMSRVSTVYVVITTCTPSSSLRRACRSVPCSTRLRRCGANFVNSADQFATRLVGTTINAGRSSRPA